MKLETFRRGVQFGWRLVDAKRVVIAEAFGFWNRRSARDHARKSQQLGAGTIHIL